MKGNRRFLFFVAMVLALGIGANAAVFTTIDAVLLRELPFRDPQQLVWIWGARTDRDKAFFSIPNFIDTFRDSKTLSAVGAYANWPVNLTGGGDAERLQGVRLTPNALDLLGASANAGRLLTESDGDPSANRVVVLSHAMARKRFGESANAVGKKVILNGSAYDIVGVLRPSFVIPGVEVEAATPLIMETDPRRTERGSNFLRVFGRMKAGLPLSQASVELAGVTERLRLQFPNENTKHRPPHVALLADEVVSGYRTSLWSLFGAVGVVLAIVCANLANLVVARSAARRREFAIRTALGARRFHIVRQVLREFLVVAIVGGLAGFGIASVAVRNLSLILPAGFPRATEIAIDWRGFAFTAVLALASVIGMATVPAWTSSRVNIDDALRGSARGAPDSMRRRTRSTLVILEVALSLVLMIGAGLLVQSFVRLQAVDSGIDSANVLVGRMSLPAANYPNAEATTRFATALIENATRLPHARKAAVTSALPLSGVVSRTDFTVAGHPPARPEEAPGAQNRWVSDAYFETMGIPLKHGRSFGTFDRASSVGVAIVDEAAARFINGDPTEQSLIIDYGDGQPPRTMKVVGGVGNVKHFGLDEAPTPTIYFPIAQAWPAALVGVNSGLTVVVKMSSDPLSSADELRRTISAIDSNVASSNAVTMDQMLSSTVAPRRLNARLMEGFAAAGLLLAVIGLYAVLTYSVAQKRHEIGVRIALGARRSHVIGLIMAQGLSLAAAGIAIGLVVSLGVTRLIAGMLFATAPIDVTAYAAMSLLLLVVTSVATYFPARKASRTDPLITLRDS